MAPDHSLDRWWEQSDSFGDPYHVPHEDEIRANAEQVYQHNREALRLFVEQAIWEALDQPEQLKVLVTLLWYWKDVDPRWVAEASFMTVADVRGVAGAEPLMEFPCLRCGAQILVRNRLHGIRLQEELANYCKDGMGDSHPPELLCEVCKKQTKDLGEQQRRLDRERYEAILADLRKRPYDLRREGREWAELKRIIHARDGNRCRLCGRSGAGVQLHVHHSSYQNYARELLEDLITLCSDCHNHFHFGAAAS